MPPSKTIQTDSKKRRGNLSVKNVIDFFGLGWGQSIAAVDLTVIFLEVKMNFIKRYIVLFAYKCGWLYFIDQHLIQNYLTKSKNNKSIKSDA